MKKVYMLLMLLLTTLYSCSNISSNRLEKVVVQAYANCSDKKNCFLELNTAFSFRWDEMYVFEINASPKYISEVIGTNYNKSTDLTRVIIFTKGNEIVHEIRNDYHPEKPFAIQFANETKKISSTNAKFKIKKPYNGVYTLSLAG